MSMRDEFDYQVIGQMSFEDVLEPPERLVAVSRIFARARKSMTLAEQKTFVYSLSKLRFTEDAKSNIVYLDKKILAEILGLKTDVNHLSVDLHNRIKELPRHSYIEICKEDQGLFDSGMVITRITMFKNRIRVKFEEEYLKLFSGLSTNYITMWSTDIFKMQSIRGVQFYEYLRQKTDTRFRENNAGLGVKALKDIFNIPSTGEGSYMRKNGTFDRNAFERYVIQPLCEDMAHCKMINLIVQPDGKFYEKVKERGRVLGYRFYWTFSARPGVATASEMKELQERVDADPEVLKVAKDILTGEKKKSGKKNKFNNFDQREISDDLIKQLEAVNREEGK